MAGIASIYQTDSMVDSTTIADNMVLNDTQDCIEVQIEAVEVGVEVGNETQDCIEVEVPNSFN